MSFNAIKHTAKESSDVNFLKRLFEKAFGDTDVSNVEGFANLIQSQEQEKIVVKKRGRTASFYQIESFKRHVKLMCDALPQPMIFQQGEVELPEGLECTDSVTMLKPDAKNYFQIPSVTVPTMT